MIRLPSNVLTILIKIFSSYDLRVIRCSNCILANHSNPNKMKVICTLDNYWTNQALFQNITLNGNKHRTAVIQGKPLFFFDYCEFELNRLHSEFYLQIETESRITCMLPTQPTPPSFPYDFATNDFFETNDAK